MRVLQRLDAAGNHIVMLEHLVDGARLLAHELAVDIGHEQFVTELGHGGIPVPLPDRESRWWRSLSSAPASLRSSDRPGLHSPGSGAPESCRHPNRGPW